MALVPLVNQRYIGPGAFPQPNAAKMWLAFLQFMTKPKAQGGPGWTIQQGAAGPTAFKQDGTNPITHAGTNDGGMSAPCVWWVLRDPGGVRELLFYRRWTYSGQPGFNPSQPWLTGNMVIGYSASQHFSTTVGRFGDPVAWDNPPLAVDEVWPTVGYGPDQYVGTAPAGATQTPSIANPGLLDQVTYHQWAPFAVDPWNFHVVADDAAPYGFYAFTSNQNTTYGFLMLDPVIGAHPDDTDPAVIVCTDSPGYVARICGGPTTVARTWLKKPAAFTNRADFATKIANGEARFQEVALASYSIGAHPSVPRGLPANIYDAKDEQFPALYFRDDGLGGANSQSSVDWRIPQSFKGISTMVRLISTVRGEFDTLDELTQRDRILLGFNPTFTLPWSGATINLA